MTLPTSKTQRKLPVIFLLMMIPAGASPKSPEAPFVSKPDTSRALTLAQAEDYALRNNPSIAAALHSAQAAREIVAQIRAGFFPQVTANAIYASVQGQNSGAGQTHIDASGLLTDSTAITRQSDGLMFSQLITDFGRTGFLTSSASFDAMARLNQVDAVRQFVLLSVDTAYYAALGARGLNRVADQQIETSRLLLDRIKVFVASNLKSQMDVSFQEAGLAQANLLKVNADGKYDQAIADLTRAMGWHEPMNFALADTSGETPFPDDPAPYQAMAFGQRPDLIAKRNEVEAAKKMAKAELAARFPEIKALAAGGINPYASDTNVKTTITAETPKGKVQETVTDTKSLLSDTYFVMGVNASLPVFTGGRLSAKEKEAELRAKAAEDSLREYEDLVFRNVRNAWIQTRTSYRAITAAKDYVKAADEAFQLSQERYTAGTLSITDVSQAQFSSLQAQIALVTAQYEYLTRLAQLSFESGGIAAKMNQSMKKD
jgi:outer membrane protein